MKQILLVYGTRPEAIKLGPVAAVLRDANVDFRVLCTGQQESLLVGTPAETDLAFGESLGLKSDGNVVRWLAGARPKIARWLGAAGRPVVVVQGDTMSAYAAAQAAVEESCPLIHLEAGVRSGRRDEPFPEERFRQDITVMADFHLAPTSTAFANLLAEGIAPNAIRVTGNTGISALFRYTEAKPEPPSDHVVITLHRRELTERRDYAAIRDALLSNMARFPQTKFVWIRHPRVGYWPVPSANVCFADPMPYRVAARLLCTAKAVLTDSGGLTEEAATLGVPTVTFRNVTDRPEAIEAGIAVVVPPSIEGAREAVESTVLPLWAERAPRLCFGEADSAALAAREIVQFAGRYGDD